MAEEFNGQSHYERTEHEASNKAKKVDNYVWDADALAWVKMTQPGGSSSSSGKATDAYANSAVSDDGTYKYFFFEDASLNYYIMRKHKTNKVFTYTKGTGGYSAVYVSSSAGPSGSPTWGTYGATF